MKNVSVPYWNLIPPSIIQLSIYDQSDPNRNLSYETSEKNIFALTKKIKLSEYMILVFTAHFFLPEICIPKASLKLTKNCSRLSWTANPQVITQRLIIRYECLALTYACFLIVF